jgi:hypothetical protein
MPSAMHTSETNKVELPLWNGAEKYDDYPNRLTIKKTPGKIASKWTEKINSRMMMILGLFVVGFLCFSVNKNSLFLNFFSFAFLFNSN